MKQFLRLGLHKDVAYHSCQVVGKYHVGPPVAPRKPIPAFSEPLSRAVVVCVRTLPRMETGNEYMVTIMCASTRFLEAFQFRNIKAALISMALIKFFTLFCSV